MVQFRILRAVEVIGPEGALPLTHHGATPMLIASAELLVMRPKTLPAGNRATTHWQHLRGKAPQSNESGRQPHPSHCEAERFGQEAELPPAPGTAAFELLERRLADTLFSRPSTTRASLRGGWGPRRRGSACCRFRQSTGGSRQRSPTLGATILDKLGFT